MSDPTRRSDGRPRVFLFTDIEDSTVLWELHPEAMASAVAVHDRVVTGAVEGAGGRVVQRVGDAMDAVFDGVDQAVEAAVVAQRGLGEVEWGGIGELRVRAAIDVGEVDERGGKFFGAVLNRAGRMLAAGHGGQILASAEVAGQVEAPEVEVRELGEFRFKGLGRAQRVFQLVAEGLEGEFPPLRVDRPAGGGSVSGYELGVRVGEGRLGVVHRGVQPSSGREVAVKRVHPGLVNDAWFVRRFEAEARIVARLDHVHLVGLRDFWRDPDGAYVVSPWFEGGSLEEVLEGRPWDLGRAARLVSQVGGALVHLHEQGLVHGGVKASNVLLDADGDAHLADGWLAARLVDPSAGDGEAAADDLRGLALVVVAVLTGGWPADPARPPSVSELRPEIDVGIERAVAAALAADAPLAEGTVRRFLDAVLPALGVGAGISEEVRNPYKGLEAFGEADAADFFGREEVLRQLVDVVGQTPLVAVVGPSGSGKSSVVRAGLLPAVHRGDLGGDWLVSDMMPGADPFEGLEAALLRVAVEPPADLGETLRSGADGLRAAVYGMLPDFGTRLLLLIDQFEELFALVDEEGERRRFLDGLVALAGDDRDRVRVVVTLRADFFDRPLDYPAFGALMKRGLVPVEALDAEGLRAAITGPARNVRAEVEPALVSQIVSDVGEEPGGLPLVQFTMTELFDRRDEGVLTLDAYRQAGGVTGALARRAEEVHGGLPVEAREAARQVFLRLVALGEGAEDTRRRVPRGRLVSLSGQEQMVELVLERFGSNRLLSFDRDVTTREPTVEVAHEALLRHWPRLRRWIDAAREDMRQHRRLRESVQQWQDAGQDDAYLLPARRVEAIDNWLEPSLVSLSDDEARYIDASRRRRQRLEAAEAERAAREAELEQRAEDQRIAAETQRATAERAERVATARGLASAAMSQLGEDPELSILLGIQAMSATRDIDGDVLFEAETALRRAIRESSVRKRFESDAGFAWLSVGPDGRVATLRLDGILAIWDPMTGESLIEFDRLATPDQDFYVGRVDLAPDGDSIAVSDPEHLCTIRDVRTGETLIELEGVAAGPTFSPDGRYIAAMVPQEPTSDEHWSDARRSVGLWNATTGEFLRQFDGDSGNVVDHTFSPDGSRLLTTMGMGHLWDVESGELVWSIPAGPEDHGIAVAFHPAGEVVAVATSSLAPQSRGAIHLIDVESSEILDTLLGHTVRISSITFSSDGGRLASSDFGRATRVWKVETGAELFVLRGHENEHRVCVAFLPGDDRLVTASTDGTARVWDISVEGGYEYAAVPGVVSPNGGNSRFSTDGRLLATVGMDGARLWEIATMDEVANFPCDHAPSVVAISPNGELVAASPIEGYPEDHPRAWISYVEVWEVTSRERLFSVVIDDMYVVSDLAFSPDSSAVVGAGQRRVVALDARSGRELFNYSHEASDVLRAMYTPDGDRIIVGGVNRPVLHAGSGEVLYELGGQYNFALTGRPGEDVVAVDEEIRLIDLDSGEERRTIRHDHVAWTVDATENLVFIATSDDVTARDIETGETRFVIGHQGLWTIHVDPSGRYLVTNHLHEWIHIHVLQVDDLLDLAHDRLTRWWTDEECEEFLQGPCPERVAS